MFLLSYFLALKCKIRKIALFPIIYIVSISIISIMFLCMYARVCVCLQVHRYCCSVFSGAQSCPTPWDFVDCSPPASSINGIFPSTYIGAGCLFPIQRIILIQGSKLHLLHCRRIFVLTLSHQGSPIYLQIYSKFRYNKNSLKNLYIIPSIRIDMRVYWKIIHQGLFHYL